jgi:Rad52/22 family double-strand break repair protein
MTPEQATIRIKQLAEPFNPSIVSFRVGPTTQDKTKGMALAYIDARDVMRRLDEVCGPENWQNDYPWSDGKRVVCRIGIKIGDDWVWKTDGAGDTDTEGEKGALSDAFKRSAVHWGIGRYLYDVEAVWVQIEQRGKSYIIAESEFPKLRARLPRGGKPAPAPVEQRMGSLASSPVPSGTGHQAAPAEHPKRPQALEAWKRIHDALEKADTLKRVEDIVAANGLGLAIVKEVSSSTYDDLMKFANARKTEFYGATG